MDKKKALQIIKSLIDKSLEAGVLKTLEDSHIIAQAYSVLLQDIDKDQ